MAPGLLLPVGEYPRSGAIRQPRSLDERLRATSPGLICSDPLPLPPQAFICADSLSPLVGECSASSAA